MIAELLSVGTELLLGEIVDSNSAYLAQELAQRGVDVYWSQRVGDNLGRLSHSIEQALSRSDLLVMCGGLGPTDDDLSREAIAKVLAQTPQVDEGLERELRARFASFNRRMPEKNLKQAWLIPSATALANPLGTAPGWLVKTQYRQQEKIILALPGPPRELKRMWQQEVLPRLDFPQAAFYSKTFKTHGIGESELAERLTTLTLGANPSVATYAKRDGVHVRVAAKAATQTEAERLSAPVLAQVREALGSYIWGSDGDDLPELVIRRLTEQKKTVATMESLTGGMVSQSLTSVAGASAIYPGGVVAYNTQVKAAFGVPGELLKAHGSVSREAALAMAEAAARLFSADYGLAITGVAGPSQTEGKPVGEVHLAVYGAGGRAVKSMQLPPLGRAWIRERSTFSALHFLLLQLTT